MKCCHLGFWIVRFLRSGGPECATASMRQIWSKSVKRLRSCHDLTVLESVRRRNPRFLKFQIFNDCYAWETKSVLSCQISSRLAYPLLRYGDISIFQDGSRPPCWILKSAILWFSTVQSTRERHHVKFGRNRSNICVDMAFSRFFKMVADAILALQNFKFLTAGTFERPNLRHCAKFHQDRKIRCWHMANFRFLKMAAVYHVGFL